MEAAARFATDMLIPACVVLRRELGYVRKEMEVERELQSELVRKKLPPIPAALMEAGVDLTDARVWRMAADEMRETASQSYESTPLLHL